MGVFCRNSGVVWVWGFNIATERGIMYNGFQQKGLIKKYEKKVEFREQTAGFAHPERRQRDLDKGYIVGKKARIACNPVKSRRPHGGG